MYEGEHRISGEGVEITRIFFHHSPKKTLQGGGGGRVNTNKLKGGGGSGIKIFFLGNIVKIIYSNTYRNNVLQNFFTD